MGRNYRLTETQEPIRGKFWYVDDPEDPFDGVLKLIAGEEPELEVVRFSENLLANLFPGIPKQSKGTKAELRSDTFYNALGGPAKKVIRGSDEHGKPITLLHCHAGNANNTMAMTRLIFSCRMAIFGIHLAAEDLVFDEVRLLFDHQSLWVGRYAFNKTDDEFVEIDGKKKRSGLRIPIEPELGLPLNLKGYSKSEFYRTCSAYQAHGKLTLRAETFVDLTFDEPQDLNEVFGEMNLWKRFFTLATRTAVDCEKVSLYRDDTRYDITLKPMKELPIWMGRKASKEVQHPKRFIDNFFFTYDDVEENFQSVFDRWKKMQKPWEAVLHRYFAVTSRRSLWVNEEFLFLAQAIESMYRARNGISGDVKFDQAAKEAYLNSPKPLQDQLGARKQFIDQLRKSRNYWTHYGEPSPETDREVLDDMDLFFFCQKLRWIIEASIMAEIGVPEKCIEKVWWDHWAPKIIEFK